MFRQEIGMFELHPRTLDMCVQHYDNLLAAQVLFLGEDRSPQLGT